jgi:DNA-binding transcriptional ArsR family regulator
MLKIHFEVEDLALLRMTSSLGPVTEGVFALHLFGRNSGVFSGWRKHVRDGLGPKMRDIERVVGRSRSVPELLRLVGRPGKEGSPGGTADDRTRQQVTAAVFEFCQVAVLPFWSKALGHMQAERDMRGRIMVTNGVGCMLDTLHSKVLWNPPVLEVVSDTDLDLHLGGRGLVLSPSVFLGGKANLLIDAENSTDPPVLVYSMPSDPRRTLDQWAGQEPSENALGALVGHTRAAALQTLTESCTTGELAQRLGISLAGASKHATVLRGAGLIATARNRNTMLHTLTSLGQAVLRSHEPVAALR